jgi:lysosomal Pro-X carboxypeptidase
LLVWAQDHWSYLAMGNYPYESSYVQPEGGTLPPWPVHRACELVNSKEALEGVALAAFMFYNATGDKTCFFNGGASVKGRSGMMKTTPPLARGTAVQQPASCAEGSWDWQWCTEHVMPFTQGTSKDMFFPYSGFDLKEATARCAQQWGAGAVPRPRWAKLAFGGKKGLASQLSNVVFSNGLLDPWSAGGVLSTRGFAPSVAVVAIPNGAHHVDLMFSNEKDTADIKKARVEEVAHITKWVKQAAIRQEEELIMEA